jgi:hypothetical protein
LVKAARSAAGFAGFSSVMAVTAIRRPRLGAEFYSAGP